MTAAPALSVVVAAYHRPEELERLLGSVDVPDVELVVVVIDGDDAVATAARARSAHVVDLPGNPGFAAAVNRGVAASTGDVVVFANDDVVFRAGALARLCASVADTGGVVVPRMLGHRGAIEPSLSCLATPARLLLEWVLLPDARVRWLPEALATKWRRPDEREQVPAAMAAVVAGPGDLVRTHPLPEAYFLYWEEQEWFWTLRAEGISVWCDPRSEVVHAGGRDDVRPQKAALLARNAIRYMRRTQGRGAALRAWPVVVLWSLRLLLLDAARAARRRSPEAAERVRARRAGLRAALGAITEVRSR